MRRSFSHWMVAAVATCLLVSSCAADQPAASPAATTSAAAAMSGPTVPSPEPATTERAVSNTAAMSTMAPTITSSPTTERLTTSSTNAIDAEKITILDFRRDRDPDGDVGEADAWGGEYRIGRDAPVGHWSWTDDSADECVYIAIMPTWVDGSSDVHSRIDVDRDEIDRLVWLDARGSVVLVWGEAIVGYAAHADIAAMVSSDSQPQCFLEYAGWIANGGDFYLCRHLLRVRHRITRGV